LQESGLHVPLLLKEPPAAPCAVHLFTMAEPPVLLARVSQVLAQEGAYKRFP
jgi:hypothetical protein